MPRLSELSAVEWQQTLLAHDVRAYSVFDKIKAAETITEIITCYGSPFITSMMEAQLIERDGPSGYFRMTPAAEALLR